MSLNLVITVHKKLYVCYIGIWDSRADHVEMFYHEKQGITNQTSLVL